MSDDLSTITPTEALQHLEERRHFLERLVSAAGTIEALKHSMEHLLDRGPAEGEESPHLTRFIESLGRKVRNLSDAEVELRLKKLDRRLLDIFSRITPLIEQVSAADTALEDLPVVDAEEDISTLKRLAQTALALRGLLARRGIQVPDLRLPLDRQQLKGQLQSISQEEQNARRSVIKQVRAVGGEIRQLLLREDLPRSMYPVLEQMMEGLRANLGHLKAGRSVQELPLAIESVSFAEASSAVYEPTPAEAKTSSAEAKPERQQETNEVKESKQASEQPSTNKRPILGPPPGLIRAFWLWIQSPWDVTWRDIREGRYRG